MKQLKNFYCLFKETFEYLYLVCSASSYRYKYYVRYSNKNKKNTRFYLLKKNNENLS